MARILPGYPVYHPKSIVRGSCRITAISCQTIPAKLEFPAEARGISREDRILFDISFTTRRNIYGRRVVLNAQEATRVISISSEERSAARIHLFAEHTAHRYRYSIAARSSRLFRARPDILRNPEEKPRRTCLSIRGGVSRRVATRDYAVSRDRTTRLFRPPVYRQTD